MSTHHDEAFWRRHLNSIAEQGIGTKAYAQSKGLPVSSLYYWRTRLNKQAPQPAARVVESGSSKLFMPLSVSGPKTAEVDSCVLSLGPSLRLELSGLPSPQWLAQVCQALVREVL